MMLCLRYPHMLYHMAFPQAKKENDYEIDSSASHSKCKLRKHLDRGLWERQYNWTMRTWTRRYQKWMHQTLNSKWKLAFFGVVVKRAIKVELLLLLLCRYLRSSVSPLIMHDRTFSTLSLLPSILPPLSSWRCSCLHPSCLYYSSLHPSPTLAPHPAKGVHLLPLPSFTLLLRSATLASRTSLILTVNVWPTIVLSVNLTKVQVKEMVLRVWRILLPFNTPRLSALVVPLLSVSSYPENYTIFWLTYYYRHTLDRHRKL